MTRLLQFFLLVVVVFSCACTALRADETVPQPPLETPLDAVSSLPPAPQTAPEPIPTATPFPTPTATPIPTPTVTPVPAPTAIPVRAAAPEESLRVAAARLKLPLPLPAARIVVLKSKRRLELWSGTQLVKTYRVALGANPVGNKQQQGDGRTPEGHYSICTRNASTSAFHIFLGLSYPALPDAARGAQHKAISWREYQIIRQRLASRGAPLWGTRLGGWVGIHGGSNSRFAQRRSKQRGRPDWTAGCIALTDSQIEELFAATQLGTPVWVQP